MSDKSQNKGCGGIFKRTLENIDENPEVFRRNLLELELKRAAIPWLGLTEPTICARGTRRLHEHDQTVDESDLMVLDTEDIIRDRADFSVAQQKNVPGLEQVELPRLWQYDLYHVVEHLPDSRARAFEDDLHSFFDRLTAIDTLLAHHHYLKQRNGYFQLLWHTNNPLYLQEDFYEITRQTQTGEKIEWIDERNPFGILPTDRMTTDLQQLKLHLLIEQFNDDTAESYAQETLVFRQKLDRVADFSRRLGDAPVLFRPFHEHHPGNYFWWTCRNLSNDVSRGQQLYRKLWENTRDYLTRRGAKNLLYVYSPDIPNQFEKIDTKQKFLDHYRTAMPDVDQIDVLSLTAYLHKLINNADRAELAAFLAPLDEEADDYQPKRQQKIKELRFRTVERMLDLCGWLREAYPDKIVGISETGWDESKILGLPNNKIYRDFWQKVDIANRIKNRSNNRRPHFVTFWRSDSSGGHFPHPANDKYSKEVDPILAAFDTQITNLPPTVVA